MTVILVLLALAAAPLQAAITTALVRDPLAAPFAVRRFRPKVTGFWRRALTAGASGALGALLSACTLAVVGGIGGQLPERSGALLATAIVSGAIAVVVATCFWPLRPRQRGLFE